MTWRQSEEKLPTQKLRLDLPLFASSGFTSTPPRRTASPSPPQRSRDHRLCDDLQSTLLPPRPSKCSHRNWVSLDSTLGFRDHRSRIRRSRFEIDSETELGQFGSRDELVDREFDVRWRWRGALKGGTTRRVSESSAICVRWWNERGVVWRVKRMRGWE